MTKLTVPTWAPAGQPGPANCASLQPSRPFATPGESVVPSGSTISARLTCESPAGSASVTVAPLGTARCRFSSVADTDGVNGTFSQPVGVKDVASRR